MDNGPHLTSIRSSNCKTSKVMYTTCPNVLSTFWARSQPLAQISLVQDHQSVGVSVKCRSLKGALQDQLTYPHQVPGGLPIDELRCSKMCV